MANLSPQACAVGQQSDGSRTWPLVLDVVLLIHVLMQPDPKKPDLKDISNKMGKWYTKNRIKSLGAFHILSHAAEQVTQYYQPAEIPTQTSLDAALAGWLEASPAPSQAPEAPLTQNILPKVSGSSLSKQPSEALGLDLRNQKPSQSGPANSQRRRRGPYPDFWTPSQPNHLPLGNRAPQTGPKCLREYDVPPGRREREDFRQQSSAHANAAARELSTHADAHAGFPNDSYKSPSEILGLQKAPLGSSPSSSSNEPQQNRRVSANGHGRTPEHFKTNQVAPTSTQTGNTNDASNLVASAAKTKNVIIEPTKLRNATYIAL
ncbi:MAG: hypothetical protein Q9227_005798 [Pyrenula ochraceoflavens]